MDSIRVSSGVKEIEVNDKGERISLTLGSNKFIQDFYLLLDDFQKRYDAAKLTEEDVPGSMNKLVVLEKETANKIDQLFGDNTCMKVFGNTSPASDFIMEFLFELLPFFEESAKKRSEKLNKYNAGRKGSV